MTSTSGIVDPRAGVLRSQYEEVFRTDQFSYGVVACREKRSAELLFDRDEIAALGSPFRSCSFMPGITQPWWSARRCWAVALPLAGPPPSGYGGCVPRP